MVQKVELKTILPTKCLDLRIEIRRLAVKARVEVPHQMLRKSMARKKTERSIKAVK